MAEGKKQKAKAGTAMAAGRNSHFFEEVMAFLLLFAIFFSLLWQGLLFEVQKTPAILLFSLLFSVVIIKTRLTGGFLLKQPFALYIFLLLTVASLFSLFKAVYVHNAILALSRNCSLLLLVLAAKMLNEKIPFAQWVIKGFTIAGGIIALLGLDGIWGGHIVGTINTLLNGGPISKGGQGFLFQMVLGDRLSSLFQYPNTTAAFLLASWFAAVHQYAYLEESDKSLKRYRLKLFALPGLANLIFLAFILTMSRGMYLISVPIMLAYYLLLPKEGCRNPLLPLIFCFIPAILIGFFSLPGNALRHVQPLIGWAAMAVLFGAAGGLSLGLSNYEHKSEKLEKKIVMKVSRRQIKVMVIAAAGVVLAVILGLFFVWQSSTPFILDDGQGLVRQFKVSEAGDYQLQVRLAQPIDETQQDMSLLLQGQNRREMLQGQQNVLAQKQLGEYLEKSEIYVPFTVEEAEAYLRLQIEGHAGADNKILSINLQTPQGETIKVKLSRYLLSEDFVQRLENILNPKSMYDRFGFYFDAFHVFLDYPLTGVGGDSWSHIYHGYQNFFYIANDIHSYAVQLAVEYGVFGLLVFAGMIAGFISALVHCIRERRERDIVFLVMTGTLFLHSMIDVDFAFYSEYTIFVLLFALMDIPLLEGGFFDRQKLTNSKLKYLGDGFVIIVMIIACLLPFRFNRAIAQVTASAYSMGVGDLESAIALSQRAVKNDPFRPEYKVLTAIRLGIAGVTSEKGVAEMQTLAEVAEKQGQFSADTLVMLVEYYYNTGQFEKAYTANGRLLEIEPYRQEYWLTRGQLIKGILEKLADSSGDTGADQRKDWLERGIVIPQEMKEMFAAKWAELQPADELLKLVEAWQEELAALS